MIRFIGLLLRLSSPNKVDSISLDAKIPENNLIDVSEFPQSILYLSFLKAFDASIFIHLSLTNSASQPRDCIIFNELKQSAPVEKFVISVLPPVSAANITLL